MYFLSSLFPVSVICTLIAIAVIIFFFFPGKSVLFPKYEPDYGNAIPVIDVLRALGKICPINSLNNWTLISSDNGCQRCWLQKFSVPVLKTDITLYGSATSLNCSSVNVYSLIADVRKWNEWNPDYSPQYIVKPFSDKKLRSDRYMEVEQIVSIIRETNKIESQTFMYRFHDFSETNVGWILFWNAKKLEFMFFLIQPVKHKNEASQCVLTHIMGTESSKKSYVSYVVQRLRNIQDFLSLSALNLLPLKFTSSVKQSSGKISSQVKAEGSSSSCPENSYLSPSVRPHKKENQHTICILVPFASSCIFGRHIDRYKLGVKNVESAASETKPLSTASKQEYKSSSKKDSTRKCLMRRAASDVGSKPEVLMSLNKYSEVSRAEINKKLQSRTENNMYQKQSSGTTSEDSETKSSIKSSQELKVKEGTLPRVKLRSFSETALPDLDDYALSKYVSENQNDSDAMKKLEYISEHAEDTLLAMDSQDHKEMFNSSISDFEVVENSEFTENIMASFMTQGNYGAAELQAEVLLASHLEQDIDSEKFHFAGGWLFHSYYKGLCVLSKITSSHFMKIASFLCQIDLPVSPKDVWKFVKNPQFRFICDETVKSVEVLDKLSSSQKLIHTYHEVGGFLKKELIDFCLLQTEREELDKYYSCFYSIEYDKCPFMNSVTRGTLRPSGWIVEKVNEDAKRSKVTYMIQALINSPDSMFIHELSILVPQSVHNLKSYITSKPM